MRGGLIALSFVRSLLLSSACCLRDTRILLSTLFYPLYTFVLARLLDNRARPCLLCCDTLAIELLYPPFPPVAAMRTTAAKPASEAGSLFALLFRTASFPPLFIAPVRTMLPVPLQRMLHSMPAQHLPAFFRSRAVQGAPGGGVGGGSGVSSGNVQGSQTGVEYLELSMSEYFFLSCAAFMLQPDIHV